MKSNRVKVLVIVMVIALVFAKPSGGKISQVKKKEIDKNKSFPCVFKDYNNIFNLTKVVNLTDNISQDFIVVHSDNNNREIIFLIQLCEPIKTPCSNKNYTELGICLRRNGEEFFIAFKNSFVNNPGESKIIYEGGNCTLARERSNYKVDIITKCDYSAGIRGFFEVNADKEDKCKFNILLKTEASCLRKVTSNCSMETELHHYDLSNLSDSRNNYVVEVNKSEIFSLNICQSVLYKDDAFCPENTSVCIFKNSSYFSYQNIGYVKDDSLFIDEDSSEIKMILEGDVNCVGSSEKIGTIITFVCDESANNTKPKFVKFDNCTYYFQWITTLGCNKKVINKTATVQEPMDLEINVPVLLQRTTARAFITDTQLEYSVTNGLHTTLNQLEKRLHPTSATNVVISDNNKSDPVSTWTIVIAILVVICASIIVFYLSNNKLRSMRVSRRDKQQVSMFGFLNRGYCPS